MSSGLLRVLVVSVALSMTSGCMFTQWTDHAFIGSPQDPPRHPDHTWATAVVLPFAMVGDIVTAPGQLIALLIMGDYGIYATHEGGKVSMIEPEAAGLDLRVASIDADGKASEITLTRVQRLQLVERLQSGAFDLASAPRIAVH